MDVEINFEESTFIKETFIDTYGLRELSLQPVMGEMEDGEIEEISKIQSVDQIVHDQINKINSDAYDAGKLIEIYNNL